MEEPKNIWKTIQKMTGNITKTIQDHQIKITIGLAVLVAIFLVTTTFALATYVNNLEHSLDKIDTRVRTLENNYNNLNSKIEGLQEQSSVIFISVATLDTKMTNVEDILKDIREDLRR